VPREQQREVQPRLHEVRIALERRTEGVDRVVGLPGVEVGDAEVVARERVPRLHLERVVVARRRLEMLPRLVQRHAALVPELRTVGPVGEQRVVQLDRRLGILLDQVQLGHRLHHELAVLAPLERVLVGLHRLGDVALLPVGEPQRVLRERLPFGDGHLLLRAARLPAGEQGLVLLGVVLVEREVRLRALERRIEVHRALAGLPRLGVLAEVAEHEREQEVRVGVVRVELDRRRSAARASSVAP
jgi:hypothetical protein